VKNTRTIAPSIDRVKRPVEGRRQLLATRFANDAVKAVSRAPRGRSKAQRLERTIRKPNDRPRRPTGLRSDDRHRHGQRGVSDP